MKLTFQESFEIRLIFAGSHVKHFIECPCRNHSWPLNKEDVEGLETSLVQLILSNKIPRCNKHELDLQDLLANFEIKELINRGILPDSVLLSSADIEAAMRSLIPAAGETLYVWNSL